MSDRSTTGKITFIHHEKSRAVIEYLDNGKKKIIQADISIQEQERLKKEKIIKKTHRYLVGDNVAFEIRMGANGSLQYAVNLQYQFNTALEILINKAAVENKFLGYIKITDDKYFIKEIDSYLFFPLNISVYEIPPTESETIEAVPFKLENIEKPDKISASLYNHNYIPEFLTAIKHFKKQTVVEATVTRISSFGIHLSLIENKLQAKLNMDEALKQKIADGSIQVSSIIPVKIKHLSSSRIVVEAV